MATLAELRGSVRTRVQDENGIRWTDAQVNEVINQAIRELSSVLRTSVNTAIMGIVAGTREVDVPDLLEVVTITRSDGYPIYGPINYNELKWDRQPTGALPIMWYKLGNTIGFYPEPSENFNLTLVYVAYASSITVDGSSPDSSLGPFADMFIISRAAAELYMSDPDLQAAQVFMDQAMKFLIEAQSNRNQFDNTRGPVVSTSSSGDNWPHYL